ncbi:hypothetical protein JW905_12290 [bacterium]|nr:hypothetical protein [candidate division CSSED10-310 bacterium]
MRRSLYVWLVVVVLAAVGTMAESVIVQVNPPAPLVVGKDGVDAISIDGFGRLREAGAPNLPARIMAIALPPGAMPGEVIIHEGEPVALAGTYEVEPAPVHRVISGEKQELYEAALADYEAVRAMVFGGDEWYPGELGRFVRRAWFRKYDMVDVLVCPLRYHPASGALLYYPDLAVEVRYEVGAPRDYRLLTDNQPKLEKEASAFISNYGEAQQWYPATRGGRSLHDFVIVTTPALESAVTDLVNWETSKGRTAWVVTTTWVDSNYSGDDLAEKIRNFLRDKYPTSEWGIEDVLLAGGYSDVPMRQVWQDVGYGKPRTDLYYAELSLPDTQSWDSNNNGRYCESSDSVDLYSEIKVGRIPWSDFTTVQSICQKSVAYENNDDPSFKKNMLLLGAFFWADTDNAVMMEAKVNQSWMSDWSITRLYEQTSGYWSTYPCDQSLTRAHAVATWSGGTYAFVNWAGHGSYRSAHIAGNGAPAFIDSDDCASLNDNYPAIIFADACSNSDTDYTNIGAKMLQRGGVGFVGSTQVALGCPGWDHPNDGSSQSLDYYFTTGCTSGDHSQGAAFQNAMRQMYQSNLWDEVKYEMCEWSLWGNPDLGMESALSGDGVITLDRQTYAPGIDLMVSVRDTDLNENPTMPDVGTVTITTFLGDQETVTITETGFSTSLLEGQIAVVAGAPVPGNGQIEVVHNGIIVAHYIDENDGHGGTNVEKTASAGVDAQAPSISAVQVTAVTPESMTVQWTTNEPADSRITYGEGVPVTPVNDANLTLNHGITITGLENCTTYVFYVESCDAAGNLAMDNNGGLNYSAVTLERVSLLMANMNTNPNWTVSGGQWAWGQPTGNGGTYGNPDPTSGFTGNNVYGYNLNGDYVNDMPEYSLTTAAIDCSNAEGTILSFWVWLGVERNLYDHAYVRISTNGTTWQELWQNGSTSLEGGGWEYWEFDISSYADGHDTVYIRWVMGATDQGWVYCGWNIDDVVVSYIGDCEPPATPTPLPPTATPTVTPPITPTPPPVTPTHPFATFTPPPFTPTPRPSTTPGLDTPTPVVTPQPGSLSIDLALNRDMFHTGEPFLLSCTTENTGESLTVEEYILLDVFGAYFFWESWSPSLDYRMTHVMSGSSTTETILSFVWPAGAGSSRGVRFWGAFLYPGTADLASNLCTVSFGWE